MHPNTLRAVSYYLQALIHEFDSLMFEDIKREAQHIRALVRESPPSQREESDPSASFFPGLQFFSRGTRTNSCIRQDLVEKAGIYWLSGPSSRTVTFRNHLTQPSGGGDCGEAIQRGPWHLRAV